MLLEVVPKTDVLEYDGTYSGFREVVEQFIYHKSIYTLLWEDERSAARINSEYFDKGDLLCRRTNTFHKGLDGFEGVKVVEYSGFISSVLEILNMLDGVPLSWEDDWNLSVGGTYVYSGDFVDREGNVYRRGEVYELDHS